MSETAKTAESPQQETNAQEILSRKRKVALVSYLAILFAVAFLLVAVSMVIENRQLQTSNAEIKGTLNNRIKALQEENVTLQQSNEQLTSDNQQLTLERDSALEKNVQASAQVEKLTGEKNDLLVEKIRMLSEITEAEKRLEVAKQTQELLYQAVEAEESGEYETLQALLDRIEPNKDLLSPTALELYESLIID